MKFISIILAASLMLSVAACSSKGGETELPSGASYDIESTNNIEVLKNKYPEYFKLKDFKGVEIYVWEMAAGDYQCGLMSGTNRNKTDSEIQSLKPLTVAEAKLILNSLGIPKEEWIVIPVVQPHSSYLYEIDDAFREKYRSCLMNDFSQKGTCKIRQNVLY